MNDIPSMNPFDAAVYLCLFVAAVMGFKSGLLRSLATIFGYVTALGLAVAATPRVASAATAEFNLPPSQTWQVFVAIFLVAGIMLSALLRFAVGEMVGPKVSIPDRVAGALLGAVRVGLLAVVLVLVFDRIIPPANKKFVALHRGSPLAGRHVRSDKRQCNPVFRHASG